MYLETVAREFVTSCQAREDLRPLLAGWDVRIELVTDANRVAFFVHDQEVELGNATGGDEGLRTIKVFGDDGLLTAILEGASDPSAAYVDGLLELDGYPEDLMRLDVVVSELW